MNLFRKLTLAAVAVVFCFGLFTVNYQCPVRGNHRGWSKQTGFMFIWQHGPEPRQARLSPQELTSAA